MSQTRDDDDDSGQPPSAFQIARKSFVLLACGMVLVGLLADPMVGAVTSLSRAAGLPSPFLPPSSSPPSHPTPSELVSSLYFAAKKRKKNISLTYSQVYGAVTMNNTMCLGLFLIVMRAVSSGSSPQRRSPSFSRPSPSDLGASSVTHKTWLVPPVLALYPLSLAFVVFLDFVVGLKEHTTRRRAKRSDVIRA